jgi:predicted tellurium resistance membrane protein TerC
MELFAAESLLNLLTLTSLEIVLGIDNVIFIALFVQHLKGKERVRARVIGLSLALILRILMLFGANWIMHLTNPLFSVMQFSVSGRDLLLIIGGMFLIVKSIIELIELFATKHEEEKNKKVSKKFLKIIMQVIFIDVILSFDSVITAVGMTNDIVVIVIAVVIAMILMLLSSEPIGRFMYANPSIKVVALAFIAMVGVMLVMNGFDIPFNKGYLYFAMFFAGVVETINIYLRKKQGIE